MKKFGLFLNSIVFFSCKFFAGGQPQWCYWTRPQDHGRPWCFRRVSSRCHHHLISFLFIRLLCIVFDYVCTILQNTMLYCSRRDALFWETAIGKKIWLFIFIQSLLSIKLLHYSTISCCLFKLNKLSALFFVDLFSYWSCVCGPTLNK